MAEFCNARDIVNTARDKGFAVPALNGNGANYDITRAIIEKADEMESPLIVQSYDNNIQYRGYKYFSELVKFLARELDVDIPIAIMLDHGNSMESIMAAVRAGFTGVMVDCEGLSFEQNVELVNRVSELVKPLDVAVEAEVSEIVKTDDPNDVPLTDPSEVQNFVEATDADLLAVAIGSAHGIFDEQNYLDFQRLEEIDSVTDLPLVLHGTCGLKLELVSKAAQGGMDKINFGEVFRLNYIRYYKEFADTLDHEGHTWRISKACMEKTKDDVGEIIEALGSAGKASLY